MEYKKKVGRYQRIYEQLNELSIKSNEPIARMATVCAVFDVDSDKPASFSEVDSSYLPKIMELIYR